MKGYIEIPITYMRGGTSKGAYLRLDTLPTNPEKRDAMILSLYGSPDPRQINGIGGADPLTSKVAMVGKSERPDADVDYLFGYVSLDEPHVDYVGNCGNISTGVGIFAIMEGLIEPCEGTTVVRIYNVNTDKIIEAHIPVENGEPIIDGPVAIDGVPGTGSRIPLFFLEPGGSKTGTLLPTGHVRDSITLTDGRIIEVSLVDAANPAIFVKAEDIGFIGAELPEECDHNQLLQVLEDIRTTGSVLMGLSPSKDTAGPAVPKVCMVSAPQPYVTIDGRTIEADDVDIVARTKALAVMHKAYAVTGGICTATAALIPGTVAHDVLSERAKQTGIVRLAHPSGCLEFDIALTTTDNKPHVEKAGVVRTARPIMKGIAYVKDTPM